jgi:hypothetical protein
VVEAAIYFPEAADTKVLEFFFFFPVHLSCFPSLNCESQPIPYSALHGICGPFFIIIIIPGCFVLFSSELHISLFLSLSTLFSATEEIDHWPPTLQLKLHQFQLATAASSQNKPINVKLSLCLMN